MFETITKYWNKLVTWNNERLERKEQERKDAIRDDIKNSYFIEIRDNVMWIVCGTNALYRAESTDTVESVINRMIALENVNLDFKELNAKNNNEKRQWSRKMNSRYPLRCM